MVVARRHQGNPVAEAEALGALRAGGEEHLGRRRMRIFLEKMMLDLPDVIDADPVGEFDLGERVLVELPFGVLVPLGAGSSRQLMFVKDAELHGESPAAARAALASVARQSRAGWASVSGDCFVAA